jgi:hypothetical protein
MNYPCQNLEGSFEHPNSLLLPVATAMQNSICVAVPWIRTPNLGKIHSSLAAAVLGCFRGRNLMSEFGKCAPDLDAAVLHVRATCAGRIRNR